MKERERRFVTYEVLSTKVKIYIKSEINIRTVKAASALKKTKQDLKIKENIQINENKPVKKVT